MDYIDLKEQLRDPERELEREREIIEEKIETLNGYLRVLHSVDELVKENEDLNDQVEMQKAEIDSLKQQLQEKEVRLSELGKLSAGVAKKSSHDDVSKALRIYLNTSKRKTLSKREAAKTVFLELITAAKLELPEDIMELLNHFDDENPEPQIVIEKAADVIAEGGVKNVKNETDD